MALAALRGDEARALALIETSVQTASLRGEGSRLAAAEWAKAILSNGLGRHRDALTAAQRATEDHLELVYPNWALAEVIEAAARTGASEAAAAAYLRLAEMTEATRTNWALGIDARSHALLIDDDVADDLYRESIDRLGHTRFRLELARAHLLYGEYLRRERRRAESRDQLRTALEMFTSMGI